MGSETARLSVATKDVMSAMYHTASDRDLTFLAAGFAYYAFVSLIPLILLALVVGSLLGGQEVAERLILFTGDFLPPAGEELVIEALATETGRAQATVVALVVATWGALKVFRGLSLAFDRIYGVDTKDSLPTQIRDGIAVIASGVGAVGLMFAIAISLRLLRNTVPYIGLLSWVALLVGLVLVFLPIYYILPPITVSLREIIPGTVFTAVGWAVLQYGFQLYTANAGQYEAYGAVGAVLLFVTWLYFAGILILIGAVINVVSSRPEMAVTN